MGAGVGLRQFLGGSGDTLAEAGRSRLTLQKTRQWRKTLRTHQAESFADVRNSRRTAFQNPRLGHEEREWQGWLTRLSRDLPVQGIPGWCIDLTKRIRENGDA